MQQKFRKTESRKLNVNMKLGRHRVTKKLNAERQRTMSTLCSLSSLRLTAPINYCGECETPDFVPNTLPYFISKKNWKSVLKIMSGNDEKALDRDSWCKCKCASCYHPILYACQLNPPVDVIKALIDADASAVYQSNCSGALPLHIACKKAASPEVIKILTHANGEALMTKDNKGRLPIHVAIESSCVGKNKKRAARNLHDVVRILIKPCPETILEEDINDMCVIEHAINANVEISIVKYLQKWSEHERRRQKKQYTII